MKSIYKYYKERLIEISGKNRSLYSRKISKKYSYDIGEIIGRDKDDFQEFFEFFKDNIQLTAVFKSSGGRPGVADSHYMKGCNGVLYEFLYKKHGIIIFIQFTDN